MLLSWSVVLCRYCERELGIVASEAFGNVGTSFRRVGLGGSARESR
jgi:hypothetical protein